MQLIVKYLIFLFLLVSLQGPLATAQDSLRILQLADLFELIQQHHPMVKRADLYLRESVAIVQKAKGNFDPKLTAGWDQKSFNGKNYFSYGQTEIKVPTQLGVTLKGGYNWAGGSYLNPERLLPDQGQAVLGLEWNPGNGLFVDPARLERQQAGLAASTAKSLRQLTVNAILEQAATLYYEWVLAYQQTRILEKGVQTASIRLEAIRESFLRGDKAAVDTLEALINLQNREYEQSLARMAFQSASLQLTNFLWESGRVPEDALQNRTPPPTVNLFEKVVPPLDVLVQTASLSHPDLQLYQLELASLDLEERWKQEQLKPEMLVQYTLLGRGMNFSALTGEPTLTELLSNNAKWGISFSYPLPNRKNRASLQLTRIKMSQKQLGLANKRQEIVSKIQVLHNEWENNLSQFDMITGVALGYQRLFQAENEKFVLGKSSLFLVNSREQKWIESQLKLAEVQVKIFQTYYKLLAATGMLPDA